jgi:hypothetical protein
MRDKVDDFSSSIAEFDNVISCEDSDDEILDDFSANDWDSIPHHLLPVNHSHKYRRVTKMRNKLLGSAPIRRKAHQQRLQYLSVLPEMTQPISRHEYNTGNKQGFNRPRREQVRYH